MTCGLEVTLSTKPAVNKQDISAFINHSPGPGNTSMNTKLQHLYYYTQIFIIKLFRSQEELYLDITTLKCEEGTR
jgi:hypothetical protein